MEGSKLFPLSFNEVKHVLEGVPHYPLYVDPVSLTREVLCQGLGKLAALNLKLFHLMCYQLLIKALGSPGGDTLFGQVESAVGAQHTLIVMRLLLRYFDASQVYVISW